MQGAGNEASGTVLPWLVIRQDGNGNRYRVGRYATREEAQKISDSLETRGHQQLYWVEWVSRQEHPGPNPHLARDVAEGARRALLAPLPKEIPSPPEAPADVVGEEPTNGVQDLADRRLQRVRPLFEALAHILPADDRERWSEEWMAEWADLGERPVYTRVAFLLRVTLRSGPYIAWTLRLAARRQRAQ